MSSPAPQALPPGRVPAETIRLCRRFHRLTPEAMARCFQVSLRTIQRWEASGVDPRSLPADPYAHPKSGPDWRAKLLIFLLSRYQATGVGDNRGREESHP